MTTIKEILAEFDEKFVKNPNFSISKYCEKDEGFEDWYGADEEIKSFIHSSHSHFIDEIIKMCEEKRIEIDEVASTRGLCGVEFQEGKTKALSDIITNLSTLIEKKDD
jgi:hypothetical protein